MSSNLEKYRADLNALINLGDQMLLDILLESEEGKKRLTKEESAQAEEVKGKFSREYQRWYTEACAIIRQIIPDRLAEFQHLYKGDGKRKTIDLTNYTIQDWTNGFRVTEDKYTGTKHFNDYAAVSMRFQNQLSILKASERKFESSLFDIRQLVAADLLDSELTAARELLKHGFLRAAGTIAGVVLEKHLAQVADNHNIAVKKKDPTIFDLNEALKAANTYEVPTFRLIQRLSDLRNLCAHNKTQEPTNDEVLELISGSEKITKTLF